VTKVFYITKDNDIDVPREMHQLSFSLYYHLILH